ncbi:MAG: undecaprenyl-diphosphate phosphatase [Oscillospiraceae bacterium]|jgi:undecaprenyl-diphosphatase|nr:undecaprenyl-diphosphate phosphatase [Oscillospiraceae bacterium]
MLINLIKALIIGVVEGITEWLPVSSTGHMILLDEFLQLGVSDEFLELFLVVVQLSAALAVAVTYFKRLFPFYPRMDRNERRGVWTLWGKIVVSTIPAAVIGLLFDDKIDALFFNWQTVSAALIFYGILFIVIEKRGRGEPKTTETMSLTYKTALLIGLFQLLSLIPGTSRSGAIIIGAMLLGVSRAAAAEYAFFLALPVMLGAGALKLLKFGFSFTGAELAVLLAGTAAAFLVSLAAVRFLVGFVKKHSFIGFGWYRIALGAAVLAFFAISAGG